MGSEKLELELGLRMADQVIPLPELGRGMAISIEVPVVLCHPETKKPIVDSGIKDGDQLPVYRCEETGKPGGFPTEFWKFVLPFFPELMKTSFKNGGPVRVPNLSEKTRFRVTVELLEAGIEDSPDEESDDNSPPSKLILP